MLATAAAAGSDVQFGVAVQYQDVAASVWQQQQQQQWWWRRQLVMSSRRRCVQVKDVIRNEPQVGMCTGFIVEDVRV